MAPIFRICAVSGEKFEITEKDQAFFKKMKEASFFKEDIPLPTLSPAERLRRRMIFRNERCLYERKCDATGEKIISCYSPDAKFPVYDHNYWENDKWDTFKYGQDFDFARSFFEQYLELKNKVPRPHVSVQYNQNSDYTNCTSWNKNCYLIFGANHNEDVYYSKFINYCRDCIDNLFIHKCEQCAQCIDCEGCYNCYSAVQSVNCYDSNYIFDCIGCNNIFMCHNLRRKNYCILNKEYSREQYKKKISEINFGSYKTRKELKKQFLEMLKKSPRKYMYGEFNENVTGDNVYHSKNSHHLFDATHCEDCAYGIWMHNARDTYDFYAWGFPAELCYENTEAGDGAYNVRFSIHSYGLKNSYYCDSCRHSSHLFGCISVKKGEYAILNKKYSKEKYEKIVPKIIEHMKRTAEFGEFFPPNVSSFSYNESVAQEYFPLERDQALKLGYRWRDEDAKEYQPSNLNIPDNIKDVEDEICDAVLSSETTKKNYKITPQELKLYRKLNIPIPRKCFDERHMDRMKLRNPRMMFTRKCSKCGKTLQSTYADDMEKTVLCEKCYHNKIN